MNNPTQQLLEDWLSMSEKYSELMPKYEFGYSIIQLSVKMLMDIAPRHGIALDTIKEATEQGIKWHVQERAEQQKNEEKK